MDKLLNALQHAFEIASATNDPKMGKVKLGIQKIVAELGQTNLALEMRGKIHQGVAGKAETTAVVSSMHVGGRFNTTPPPPVFIDPNSSAAVKTVTPAASKDEGENDADAGSVKAIYSKIAGMAPGNIVTTYGESSIDNMIKKLGGDMDALSGKKPAQKAAILKALCANIAGLDDTKAGPGHVS
jgi:hypothetical protein